MRTGKVFESDIKLEGVGGSLHVPAFQCDYIAERFLFLFDF